jgi:hypothetical protein
MKAHGRNSSGCLFFAGAMNFETYYAKRKKFNTWQCVEEYYSLFALTTSLLEEAIWNPSPKLEGDSP